MNVWMRSEMPSNWDTGTSTPRKCTAIKLKQEKPSTNQVEYHILLDQDKLLSWIRDKEMFLTACSPLAKGHLAYHPLLQEIGRKHGKNATQVALRWLIQQNQVATVPKASTHEKRRQNFAIFDFELDQEDLETIARLDKDQRFVDLPGMAPDWD